MTTEYVAVTQLDRQYIIETQGTLRADVAIIGAGPGGCTAALGAATTGRQVVLSEERLFSEETLWIGGQLISQAVVAAN